MASPEAEQRDYGMVAGNHTAASASSVAGTDDERPLGDAQNDYGDQKEKTWTTSAKDHYSDEGGELLPPAALDNDLEKSLRIIEIDGAVDDPNIVSWDGDDDPENPYNWPAWRKLVNCTIISFLTFLSPLTSSVFAPGVPALMSDLHSDSPALASFVVSVYILGFAFGPLMIAPLSEIYGRIPIYHVCNVGFVAFLVGCALAPHLEVLIVFRFFSGVFGSCPLTNGGGSVSDMIRQEKRGMAMAWLSLGPLIGPIIGPVAGGFLVAAKGWRWVFWVLTIVAVFLTIVMALFMRETYAPVVLQRKVVRLRFETGNEQLRSEMDPGLAYSEFFKRSIVRPLKMFTRSPIIILLASYVAVTYGYLYLLFTSITQVFQETYHFSTQAAGLVYLGIGVGSVLGMVIFSTTSDRYMKKMSEKDGQGMKPEYRLQTLPLGAFLVPVGFFIYGWTAQYRVHWIAPIMGMGLIGIGNMLIFMVVQVYLVDAFTIYAASALAANTVLRSVAGAVLPLCGLKMYAALGLGWGNSLLAFIALAMLPVPYYIIKKGECLRTKYELKNL